jgi:HAD superfamily hydrolase (TIGR01490 family)
LEQHKTIAAFDFDGTITFKDTYLVFIIHCFGSVRTFLGFLFLSPIIILYKLKFLRNDIAKQITFTFFFKGMSQQKYLDYCISFKERISKIVRPEALKKIAYHEEQGHYLVIVSASMEDWIRPWADENYFNHVIGTQPEITQKKLTGKFFSKNCYGHQKVKRLNQHIPDVAKLNVYAYGDSKGDKQLLEMADNAFYRNFG